jgi:hypothetical protein
MMKQSFSGETDRFGAVSVGGHLDLHQKKVVETVGAPP